MRFHFHNTGTITYTLYSQRRVSLDSIPFHSILHGVELTYDPQKKHSITDMTKEITITITDQPRPTPDKIDQHDDKDGWLVGWC
mmetsp:Transcript_17465/g.17566  ORF Transcript_17465/g.17566 Transcript_17465/m.17566 type:complete len:84 (-) Transcript_17465:728-979(-)